MSQLRLGVVGVGDCGKAVVRRAIAFGMRVIAYDPYLSELAISEAGVEPVSFSKSGN